MKKMFFTAMALVAFSTVSLANVKEEKKEVKKEEPKKEVDVCCTVTDGKNSVTVCGNTGAECAKAIRAFETLAFE